MFRREVLDVLNLKSDRSFEPEFTAKVAKSVARSGAFMIPISYSGRTYEEKKIGLKDAFSAVLHLPLRIVGLERIEPPSTETQRKAKAF